MTDAKPSPVVETRHGPVRGCSDGKARAFLGIRFAAPPVGGLRWRAPHPPSRWTEPADATRFAPVPVQQPNRIISFPAGIERSEDCLAVNVWTPADAEPGEGLPVLAWVHGGAYVFGGTAQAMYDGAGLAARGRVIVVTIGYRLGPLGFLDLSRLGRSADADFEPNVALRDVVAGLEWIRDNVAAFGGDPSRVTLWGESAGAGIVTTLMTAPSCAGLFARAIAESSPATSVYGQDRAEIVARAFIAEIGVEPADAASLRALPAERLSAAGFAVFEKYPPAHPGTLAFAPVVDGDLVPEHPIDVFARGQALPVPLLIGTNRDETSLFTMMSSPLMPVTRDALQAMADALRTEEPAAELPDESDVVAAYGRLRRRRRGPAISRDLAFRMPALWIVEGHHAVADTYLYRFDWSTPMLTLLGIGATHASELRYVWGRLETEPSDPTFRLGGRRVGRDLSERMQTRWLGFVHGDGPDAPAGPWPAYRRGSRESLVIDRTDRVVPDLDADLRTSWGATAISFR